MPLFSFVLLYCVFTLSELCSCECESDYTNLISSFVVWLFHISSCPPAKFSVLSLSLFDTENDVERAIIKHVSHIREMYNGGRNVCLYLMYVSGK